MFEKASRLGLRFATEVGSITTEDLWKLSLTSKNRPSLDAIAIDLHKTLQSENTVSFVDATTAKDDIVQLKFDIVKHIIGVKIAERDAAAKQKENAEKKQGLLALIARKKNEQLEGQSLEELEAMVNSLA